MGGVTKIGVMGERDRDYAPHHTLDGSLHHAASHVGVTVEVDWVATGQIRQDPHSALSGFSGLWAAPGWLESIDGALEGIKLARETGIPLLGTCAGFQHAVLEFAKNKLRFQDAAHEAYDPSASRLFLTALACSVKGQRMPVHLLPGSRAYAAYRGADATEEYYCSYGLNPEYEGLLKEHGLQITGHDESGAPRVLEIRDHPFYVATLFVPQIRSRQSTPHPLITAFVQAAAMR